VHCDSGRSSCPASPTPPPASRTSSRTAYLSARARVSRTPPSQRRADSRLHYNGPSAARTPACAPRTPSQRCADSRLRYPAPSQRCADSRRRHADSLPRIAGEGWGGGA